MDPQTSKPLPHSLSVTSLLGSCALLAALLVPLAAAAGWWATSRGSSSGWLAAGIAAGVCFAGASLALVAKHVGQRLGAGVHGVLLGIFLRTGIPLGAAFWLEESQESLSDAGIFGMILSLYLCTLTAETLLALRLIPKSPKALSGVPSQPSGV